ncbi:MAG: hypothetical protein RBR13_09550 [Tenuifilaceae bacterium]|nr:hypothetical protein [Tenuifilaceae bacterium]
MITGIRTDITIGGFRLHRCPELWIESIRHRPVSRAGIVVPDAERFLFRSVQPGDSVSLRMGYRNQQESVWSGLVTHLAPGNTGDQIAVHAVGLEQGLVQTRIVQSWCDESPEAIVSWAVSRAGFTPGRIDGPGVVLPHVVSAGASVWELVRQVEETLHRGHGICMDRWALWADGKGRAHWGDFDAEGGVPVIETGAGLIRHTPSGGRGRLNALETFLIPHLRHSMLFVLADHARGVSGKFRALSVRHELRPDRVRTLIKWGQEHEKY